MAAAVVTAAFQDIGEADQIGVDIGIRVGQRVAHAGLGGEMHDVWKAVLGEQRGHGGAVGEIELGEAEACELGELGEPRLLQLGIVIGIEIVEPDNGAALLAQAAGDVIADEAGRPGHQNGLVSHRRFSGR